jgi:hypothetical protein
MRAIAVFVGRIAETVWAPVLMFLLLVSTPITGRRRLRWGATVDEAAAPMPGDELAPVPKWAFTYGITVNASVADTWPWLVQIGQGRGGFYSYQMLENLFGCRIHNADEVIPELQGLRVGDEIKLHPKAPGLRVAILEPGRALALCGAPVEVSRGASYVLSTWQFLLLDRRDGTTRLLVRGRYDYSPGLANRIFFGRLPLEPIMFVMSRKMLLGLKKRAEGHTPDKPDWAT